MKSRYKRRFIVKRFWFGYEAQKELVCSRHFGKCYWKIIYWANDLYPGCRKEVPLTKEEARKELDKYKEYLRETNQTIKSCLHR